MKVGDMTDEQVIAEWLRHSLAHDTHPENEAGRLDRRVHSMLRECIQLRALEELNRQAIEKNVSARDRAEIQAFYDNLKDIDSATGIAKREAQLAARGELKRYREREPLVTALLDALGEVECECTDSCGICSLCEAEHDLRDFPCIKYGATDTTSEADATAAGASDTTK